MGSEMCIRDSGMLFGFGFELYLWLQTAVPWTWWVMIGTMVTFVVGYIMSAMVPNQK